MNTLLYLYHLLSDIFRDNFNYHVNLDAMVSNIDDLTELLLVLVNNIVNNLSIAIFVLKILITIFFIGLFFFCIKNWSNTYPWKINRLNTFNFFLKSSLKERLLEHNVELIYFNWLSNEQLAFSPAFLKKIIMAITDLVEIVLNNSKNSTFIGVSLDYKNFQFEFTLDTDGQMMLELLEKDEQLASIKSFVRQLGGEILFNNSLSGFSVRICFSSKKAFPKIVSKYY